MQWASRCLRSWRSLTILWPARRVVRPPPSPMYTSARLPPHACRFKSTLVAQPRFRVKVSLLIRSGKGEETTQAKSATTTTVAPHLSRPLLSVCFATSAASLRAASVRRRQRVRLSHCSANRRCSPCPTAHRASADQVSTHARTGFFCCIPGP